MSLRMLEDELLRDPLVQEGYEGATAAEKMGLLLRELRETVGLTQRGLAASSGVQQSEISRYEGGQAPRGITISQLETLAHAQGMEVVIGFARKATAFDDKAVVIDGRTLLLHTVL